MFVFFFSYRPGKKRNGSGMLGQNLTCNLFISTFVSKSQTSTGF
jgi:hypothetical protein